MSKLPDACNVIGEPEHREKWMKRITELGHSLKDARWLYDEALDQQQGRYRFPKFVDAINANIGRLQGINSMPEPGKPEKWNS